jgi:hypothetical protein
VIAAALATFLAVVVLLAVQLQAGLDPVLGGASVASLSEGQQSTKVVTRASGGGQVAQPSSHATSKPVSTHASGAIGEVEDD